MDKLRQLVRTYPQATAGIPTRITLRRHDRSLLDDLPAEPADHGTDADLRQPAHLTAGYDVQVTGGRAQQNGRSCR